MDNSRREIRDGWVAITNGFVSAIGDGAPPPAKKVVDASECLVTPGLVNTHHQSAEITCFSGSGLISIEMNAAE
mgnify:CR=1 FL=1